MRTKRKSKKTLIFSLATVCCIGFSLWFYQSHHNSKPAVSKTSTVSTIATPIKAIPKPAVVNHCDSNTNPKEVIVSLSQQHMWACSAQDEVYDSAVTTGATSLGDATPTGTWQVYSKQTNRHLIGSDSRGSWDDFVNYWMPFYGDYGFHDASWQTFPFGDLQDYPTQGSHGCVHLSLSAMAWLYNWAEVGTTVTVQA